MSWWSRIPAFEISGGSYDSKEEKKKEEDPWSRSAEEYRQKTDAYEAERAESAQQHIDALADSYQEYCDKRDSDPRNQ